MSFADMCTSSNILVVRATQTISNASSDTSNSDFAVISSKFRFDTTGFGGENSIARPGGEASGVCGEPPAVAISGIVRRASKIKLTANNNTAQSRNAPTNQICESRTSEGCDRLAKCLFHEVQHAMQAWQAELLQTANRNPFAGLDATLCSAPEPAPHTELAEMEVGSEM
jgi:hypothetical protein